ncbi:MAG TPA: hypothetical protein VE891_12400 [Allosphingosinicella sp.]|nr:hypothetical protein [Allosphingosinicella sp.]
MTCRFSVGWMLFFLSSCNNYQSDQARALEVADQYIAGKNLRLNAAMDISISRSTNGFLVKYHLPSGYAGGDYQVLIDYKSMKVKEAIGGQ